MAYIFECNYSKINKNSWSDLVKESNIGSIYQTPEMYKFWENQKECTPYIYTLNTTNNELVAVCLVVVQYNGSGLKKHFSRRAIIYGGPVLTNNCDKQVVFNELITKVVKNLKSKAIYCEFRLSNNYCDFKPVFEENNFKYLPYQNFKIKLKDEEEVFGAFTSEKRRQIRRSFREGVEISYKNSDENILGVYNIIHQIYNDKVKKPLPKYEFFKNLAQFSNGNVVALIYEGKVIGGGFLVFDNHTVYDWYRGGLDRDYKHQYPSTVAAWAVMKYGFENKLTTFDFMGAGIKGEDYGVRKFKAQFGGELVEHGRYMRELNPILYKIAMFGLSILQKL
ncbi:peptidoglycan bridge formation glycyltransferase FemA/FemB family protein [Aureibaculum marinum]|uniref:Peptidoglycan bridge formation glycyltransferase FemA/FemB family protein n=1 Tax=Aureibaculum marinum TaxID=2487930 RepID=A0A3N4NUJ8_9FLAO|nr:peptidoglycan bridge formation glycyltransferase FemA/FemB family protein [Aureibaculum marinum]RPD98008.1 peptidoglycan bridge formation glycyltransferase FemA/FemB family protein [Aureibaculum marinum]